MSTSTPAAFYNLTIHGTEAPWCVDGRPDTHHTKGMQMLGGSILPILLFAIINNKPWNEESVEEGINLLQKSHIALGVHRGAHKHPEQGTCDCGFADKLPLIIQTAIDEEAEISNRLTEIYEANKKSFGELSKPFAQLLSETYQQLKNYGSDHVTLIGEKLVHFYEEHGAIVEEVEGNHAEQVAFVNLHKNTTFDTNDANAHGTQAFNLDLWAVVDQADILGVSAEFAIVISLILYEATEIVLVEKNGKAALPVLLHE